MRCVFRCDLVERHGVRLSEAEGCWRLQKRSCRSDLMPAVVGMSGTDGECPVQLLGGDDGGEFVREGDAAEGEGAVGAGERRRGPAVGRAYGEDELLGAGVLKRA